MQTVEFINQVVRRGDAAEMILVSEALQERQLIKMAEEIKQRGAKVVLIAGPSSSGKTSTSKRLCIQLLASGLHPVALSTDNWFVDREFTPRDKFGKYDFESIYAMDLKLFNSDLQALTEGREVQLPTYNFTVGVKEWHGERLQLSGDMILVIEGIHALNPLLTERIAADDKYKIFAAPMTPVSLDGERLVPTTANRLIRRISRDYQTRGQSAQNTIAGWNSVRRGEKKWILPFQSEADAVFDTSMLYELAALRERAEPIIREVPEDAREYRIAKKLVEFLERFETISANDIPRSSLMREFIGGSIFNVG